MRQAMEAELSVIRVESHLERDQPPAAVWLGYQGPPAQGLAAQWRWYVQRWPIEPSSTSASAACTGPYLRFSGWSIVTAGRS